MNLVVLAETRPTGCSSSRSRSSSGSRVLSRGYTRPCHNAGVTPSCASRRHVSTSAWSAWGVYLGLLFVFCLATEATSGSTPDELPPPCNNNIYCYGSLLHTVQMAHLYPDSKTFVDMKLKRSANETLQLFDDLMARTRQRPNPYELEKFVTDNFDPAGSEFEEWTPNDWIDRPRFLDGIKDPHYRDWASRLNQFWKMLGKKMKDEVRTNQDLYSIIYVPHPVIVPGGRFREFYYWDSYWIVKGLLLSQMHSTVRGMLENFISIIERFGHIPNGGRIYYAERSQPPMFVPMVHIYVEETGDMELLKKALPAMEAEFQYWLTNHSVTVRKDGVNYNLFRYMDRSTGPRPESYREDVESANAFKTERERQEHYSELKAAAESGWDFSSRWFIQNGTNKGNLTDLKTRHLIPVDLNAIVYWNADLLSTFFRRVGDASRAAYYADQAAELMEAVTKVLWLDDVGAWLDYDMLNEKERDYFYPTNIAPLWTRCYDLTRKDYFVGKVMKYIEQKEIMVQFLGGIPTTLDHSGEQWDFPNAWPPLQYIMVMGLHNTSDAWATELGFQIANRWVKSNYVAFNETGHMFEKYDATVMGGHGTGGEYDVQLGFGWTNGVIMDFLNTYGSRLSSAEDEFEAHPLLTASLGHAEMSEVMAASAPSSLVAPLVITALVFLGLFAGGCIW